MAKMTRDELKSIVKARITDSVGYIDGEIQEERRENLDYYYGEPFGNEIKDRSQVVSTDVQDVIESIMPDLVEMFAAGDEVGKFEPVGPEDEQAADQATDYVNFIWMKDNPGFEIIHDWIKDAILQNYGVIKQYWDDTPVKKKETLTGVNILRLAELEADPDIKIIRFNETEAVEEHQVRLRDRAHIARSGFERVGVRARRQERRHLDAVPANLADEVSEQWERGHYLDPPIIAQCVVAASASAGRRPKQH